jgi:RNA polymerase sigma factor (TIGR02999 family)
MADAHGHTPNVTQLLKEWSDGHRTSGDRLFASIYDELRRMARSRMAGERRNHTLQATALVHEAFERLVEQKVAFRSRAHFFGIAAECMRRILLDHARRKRAAKRPPPHASVDVDEAVIVDESQFETVLIVQEALEKLEQLDARQARIAMLRYFGGLENAEIAEVVGVSVATVKRDWDVAKLWLRHALKET